MSPEDTPDAIDESLTDTNKLVQATVTVSNKNNEIKNTPGDEKIKQHNFDQRVLNSCKINGQQNNEHVHIYASNF